jgi:hypothetical protein
MRRPIRSSLHIVLLALLATCPPRASAQGSGPGSGPPSTALTDEERASLEAIRDFVRAAAARYRMLGPLEVSVASWVGTGGLPQYANAPAVYTRGALYLNRRLLKASNRDLVIAKALAYEMLRAPSKATTLAERDRERATLSLESNAWTVTILVEVGGLTEQSALDAMYAWLHAIHRAAGAGGRPPPPGGVTACDEIADLLRRHPAVKEHFAGRECAPP